MPDWIAKANIAHFKKLLETEKDPQKRSVIERELAEEEAKLCAPPGLALCLLGLAHQRREQQHCEF